MHAAKRLGPPRTRRTARSPRASTLAAPDLANGRVVRASEQILPCPRAYYFVCPESYLALPKLQHLLEWLREIAAAFPRPGDAAALISADPISAAPTRVAA